MQQGCVFYASAGGVGWLPYVPGTWGSLLGLILWRLSWSWLPYPFFVLITCVAVLLAYLTVHALRDHLEEHDPSWIVIDEVVGMWISLWGAQQNNWIGGLAFFIFRVLDIKKPGWIGVLDQRYKNAFGVVFDDVLAGLFTAFILQLLHIGMVLP
jgi:phosphatidylglycerophosphatase A